MKKPFVWLVIAVVLISPFVYLFGYVMPCFDDYWYAWLVQENGFMGAQKWWYLNAQGRVFSNMFISLDYYFCKNITSYQIVLLLLFSIYIYSSFALWRAFWKKLFNNTSGLMYATGVLFLLLIVATIPGTSNVFYWLPGVATYTLGMVFVNYILINLLNKKPNSKQWIGLLIAGTLSCVTSELIAIEAIMSFGVVLLLRLLTKEMSLKEVFSSKEFLLLCYLMVFFYVVVYNAPGVANRQADAQTETAHAGDIGFALKTGLHNALLSFYGIIYVKRGILYLLLVLTATVLFRSDSVKVDKRSRRNILIKWSVIQFVLAFFAVFLCVIHAQNTGHSKVIPRLMSLSHFLWLFDFLFTGVLIAYVYNLRVEVSKNARLVSGTAITACLLLVVWASPLSNMRKVVDDIANGREKAHKKLYTQQRNTFLQCEEPEVLPLNKEEDRSVIYVWDFVEAKKDTRYRAYYESYLCTIGANQ